MKVQTLSIVVGTSACNAKCNGCVGKMTEGVTANGGPATCINTYRNLKKALLFAKQSNVSTVLLTGKGEPTLYPEEIMRNVAEANRFEFPFIELQTNGINLMNGKISDEQIKDWWQNGLTTICLSAVSLKQEENADYFGSPHYPDIGDFVRKMHSFGFAVRLSVVMMKGYTDSFEKIEALVDYCLVHHIEQFTFRNLSVPELETEDSRAIVEFCKSHQLSLREMERITYRVAEESHLLLHLMHGAEVRDFKGQNVCLTNCLTLKPDPEEIRQLIYTPRDGHLRYDWVYKGAILF